MFKRIIAKLIALISVIVTIFASAKSVIAIETARIAGEMTLFKASALAGILGFGTVVVVGLIIFTTLLYLRN